MVSKAYPNPEEDHHLLFQLPPMIPCEGGTSDFQVRVMRTLRTTYFESLKADPSSQWRGGDLAATTFLFIWNCLELVLLPNLAYREPKGRNMDRRRENIAFLEERVAQCVE